MFVAVLVVVLVVLVVVVTVDSAAVEDVSFGDFVCIVDPFVSAAVVAAVLRYHQ